MEKEKKTRRNKAQLEIDIMNAFEKLVIERGFTDIPLLVLVKEANIDPNIFYRMYGTIDKLCEEFTGKYDFWVNETLRISDIKSLGDRKFYASALKTLFTELLNNGVMQKLLLWEISDNNSTTRKTAAIREKLTSGLRAYYEGVFKPAGIDINTLTAWFISGIYYLVLHKDISMFCSVDFSKEDGGRRLCKAIDFVVDLVFDKLEQREKEKAMIVRMQEKGICRKDICEILNISSYQYGRILK